MSKFKVGDKVAPKGKPYLLFGQVLCEAFEGWYNIKTRDGDWGIMPEDDLVLYDETALSDDEIYDMLKPKMDKAGVFMVKMYNSVKAIALAYRSGYLRAEKGRPFKIGGEKD